MNTRRNPSLSAMASSGQNREQIPQPRQAFSSRCTRFSAFKTMASVGRRKRIIIALDLIAEFRQQLFEQPGQVFLLPASAEFNHEFVFHRPDQYERQQSVIYDPGRIGLIENKSFPCETCCQLYKINSQPQGCSMIISNRIMITRFSHILQVPQLCKPWLFTIKGSQSNETQVANKKGSCRKALPFRLQI